MGPATITPGAGAYTTVTRSRERPLSMLLVGSPPPRMTGMTTGGRSCRFAALSHPMREEVATVAKRTALEQRLGVTFKDRSLLEHALIHSSYVNENPQLAAESNERLEFLGDAVLGLIVADELYLLYPDWDEGKLTELRAHLVRRDTLADVARRLQLGEALQLGRGEEAGGGPARPTNLAHAYEAVIGAVFLDRGFAVASRFVRRSLEEEFSLLDGKAFPIDPKSRLQEISQSRYQSAPQYRLVKTEGPDHDRRFTVEVVIDDTKLGLGSGASKQQAEKAAATKALRRLEENA